MNYVMRYGRRIEVVTINPDPVIPAKQRSFEPRWVKLPRHWISSLARSKSVNTYRLAHLVLIEAYRDRRCDGWVNLTTQVTGMPRSTKREAARELAELGLIILKTRQGNEALKARVIHNDYEEKQTERKKENKN